MDFQTSAYQSSEEGEIISDFVMLGVFSAVEGAFRSYLEAFHLVKPSEEKVVKGNGTNECHKFRCLEGLGRAYR